MSWLKRKEFPLIFLLSIFSAIVLIGLLAGCAGGIKQADKPGAQLWGENCGRCHNIRPITSFDDPHWETVVMHMRTRASMSEDEARKIAEFLKSSN